MSSHPEKEEKSEASAISPKKSKLAVIGHYILLALGPVLAIAALAVAVLGMKENHSGEKHLSATLAKIEGLNTSLAASKAELEKLKAVIAHDKTVLEEERKKQDELLETVVQNISPMQIKLKIKPTLDNQLHQETRAAASSGSGTSSEKNTHADSREADKKLKFSPEEKTPPTRMPPPERKPISHTATGEKKSASQALVIKEAIEQYNKK